MRIFVLLALALASPVMAQDAIPDAAPDTADGYPLEAKYTDNSDNFPRDEMAQTPTQSVILDAKGQPIHVAELALKRGDTVLFRVDSDGMATDIRKVDSKMQPAAGEIRAYMGGNGGNTTLLVLNKGSMAYNYKAVILSRPDAEQGTPTSVCTLLPGISTYELWPYPIVSLVIGPFAAAPDGEMVCQ